MTAELISDYLLDKKIIIVDSSSTIRSAISNVLYALGALKYNIYTFSDIKSAERCFKENSPQIVISDFEIQGQLGLSLLTALEDTHNKAENRIFILMSSSPEQTAIAMAAEDQLDSFIVKPFQYNYLLDNFTRTILAKISPSEYNLKIQEGKAHLIEENHKVAMECFAEAERLSAKPALAKYYSGYTCHLLGDYLEAVKYYQDGLAIVPRHFRCMNGMFEVLQLMNKKLEAYNILKQFSKFFPLSISSLQRLFYLASETGNFKDLDEYYTVFETLENKSPVLINDVKEAYFEYGKKLLECSAIDEGLEKLEKAVFASAMEFSLIQKIIMYLIETGLNGKIFKFLEKVKLADKKKPAYLALEFYLQGFNEEDTYLIDKGRKLVRAGIHDHRIYRIVLDKLVARNNLKAAETFVYQAIENLSGTEQTEFKEWAEKIENMRESQKAQGKDVA